MRVLVLHNRYRVRGGEERAVELHLAALGRAQIEHGALVRDSAEAGAARAARSMLGGGESATDVGYAVRETGATIVHAHNVWPLIGPRSLTAAREAGAGVVMHLHNYRLFCAIGTCFRDGAPCFRCRGRRTLPGLVLNCRDSLPEAVVYATALSRHQPELLRAVNLFLTPSRFACEQLTRLGVPRGRLRVLPHYLPASGIAPASEADRGEYALYAGRLSEEKGVQIAVEAARRAGVPLRIAGDGPLTEDLRRSGADLLGRVDDARLRELIAGAALALQPSLGDETFGFFALEAMGAGVPVIASRSGALPEVVGGEHCLTRGDVQAFATRMRALWRAPAARREQGEEAIARVRGQFGEDSFVRALSALYREVSET